MSGEESHDLDRKTFTSWKLDFLDALAVDPEVTDLDFRLSYQLMHYVNGITRTAWPGGPRLAREISADIRSVRRSLKRLTEGPSPWWLRDKKGRRGRATVYRPNFDKLQAIENAEKSAGVGTSESPSPERGEHKTESRVTQMPLVGDSNAPGTVTGESPQHLKRTPKKHLSAPAASPSPRMGEAQPSSLGEDSKDGAQAINTSPGTTVLNASKKAEGGLGVRAQVPDIGAELRRRDEETKARQRASTDLHTFLADALGTDGYAGWITRTTPETEALLAEQFEGAPSGGAARRQHELRLLRMIEGGATAFEGAGDAHLDTPAQTAGGAA